MNRNELLISAGFAALFVIYYFSGWFCDKFFRLTMRKTKLKPIEKVIHHFRGSKHKENRGHAIICVRFERIAFLALAAGALCVAALKFKGGKLVMLGSMFLMALFAGYLVFQLYVNIGKYKKRKKHISENAAPDFEGFRNMGSVAVGRNVRTEIEKVEVPTDDKLGSLESGRKIIENKGILDDDVFSPYVSDVTDKFRGVKLNQNFSEGDNIEAGKNALKDMAEKQLKNEAYYGVKNFEEKKNAYSDGESEKDAQGNSDSIKNLIDEHRADIDIENKLKPVNKNAPVRKEDTQ